jgi:hypothetical protein
VPRQRSQAISAKQETVDQSVDAARASIMRDAPTLSAMTLKEFKHYWFSDAARAEAHPDALAWVKDIAEDLRRANLHRNHIVHGPWNNFDPPTGKATKIKFRKNKSYFVKPYSYTAPQIREIAFNMYSIMQRMGFLMGHVLGPDMKLGPSDMKLGPSRGNCMPPCPLPD